MQPSFTRLRWLRVFVYSAKKSSRLMSHIAYDPSKIRNIALVAHIDSGKTTLTESILYTSKYLASSGSVDTGSTTTDFLPAERERGITIQSASIPVKWKQWTFNLIDTPGHADFGMEVESASRVVDGAIVLIDSVEGVEAQTKQVWSQLNRYDVPSRILFLNKMDRVGASFRRSIQSLLHNKLHPKPVVLTLPVASFDPEEYSRAIPGLEGIIDLVKWEVWKWNAEGNVIRQRLPYPEDQICDTHIIQKSHPLFPHAVEARITLLENLAMFSNTLLDSMLSGTSDQSHDMRDPMLGISERLILDCLRASTLKNEILPVLCGAAVSHKGTDLVLDYAGELLASPVDVTPDAITDSSSSRILAWKVAWSIRKGWVTYVRVYSGFESGVLHQQKSMMNISCDQRELISKLYLPYASEHQQVDELPFGSVGIVLGLKHTRTGDTLVSHHKGAIHPYDARKVLGDISIPPPVMSASVIPQSHKHIQPVHSALLALSRTDPSVRVEQSEGQLLVHGLGALHLEIMEGRLRNEWNVRFEMGPRLVSYREGFRTEEFPFTSTWGTESNGKPVTAEVQLLVRGLREDETGLVAWGDNLIVGKKGIPLNPNERLQESPSPLAYVARGIYNGLSSSPHTSLPLTRIRVQVLRSHVPLGANPSILTGACHHILRQAIKSSGLGPVLEPYVRLHINVEEDSYGKLMRYLTDNGGEILGFSALDTPLDSTQVVNEDEIALPYSEDGLYIPPNWLSPSSSTSFDKFSNQLSLRRTIHASAPLSKMLDFNSKLRALSGGRGSFSMVNDGFKIVSQERQTEILKEIGKA